jgi:zinc transport system substrate-binding protein
MMRLTKARLFLYLSADMEVWVSRLVADAPATLRVRAVGPPPAADEPGEEPHDHSDECLHESASHDPHVWLDPLQALAMVDRIAAALAEADPVNAPAYHANAAALQSRLMALHQEIQAALANCRSRVIICGGHFAFGHFTARYGLEHLSPYSGFSPNAQPSPRALAQLVRRMREGNASAIFYEEILDPRLARVLADETGAQLLPLHSLHNRTPDDVANGATYFSLMRRNLESIQAGLGCAP